MFSIKAKLWSFVTCFTKSSSATLSNFILVKLGDNLGCYKLEGLQVLKSLKKV